MRLVFYIASGVIATLIGLNLSLPIVDLFQLILKTAPDSVAVFINRYLPISELILFPFITSCVSLILVLTTIYTSNPIHHKANRRIRGQYIKVSLFTGILTGIVIVVLISLFSFGGIPAAIRRIAGWSVIGLGVGISEGFCWQRLSKDGVKSTTFERPIKSALLGFFAGIISAVIIEALRQRIKLYGYEDLVGLTILGTCLGIALAISTTPTYQVALRAGRGFECRENRSDDQYPKISDKTLSIVYFPDTNKIEEGLSIQLPRSSPEPLVIGSIDNADIFLPNIPAIAAKLHLEQMRWKISTNVDNKVQIQS